jgi:hypothetical protein
MENRASLVMNLVVPLAALLAGLSTPAFATFHLMQIEQVIGGVDGDTTAQAIQSRMRSGGQNLVNQAKLVVFDAAGLNPITIIDMTNNVANGTLGDRVLIVSANFANYTSPSLTADFVMTQLIPTNYLTAGRLAFEDDSGGILWSLSWGGTNYTGSNIGEPSHFNDADGDFGPPVPGSLPSDGTHSLLFTNGASAKSLSNVVDYVVCPGSAAFTNNARVGFVVASKPSITAITRESDDLRITWTTIAGRTNFVQSTAGDTGGSFSNNFTDISSPIVVPGSGQVGTNYLDSGGATNFPSRYYRVRLVP